MNFKIFSVSSLLLSIAILMLGNGPLPTILGIRLAEAGTPIWLIGIVMSLYYVGFVVGSKVANYLIFLVGHIRTFAVFGSTMSAITLAHAFLLEPIIWGIFRLTIGICAIGMFMCIESWLNAKSDNNNRGQIFSFYVIALYMFSAFGQFLVQIPDESGFIIYLIISILMSLAIIPVSLTRIAPPEIVNVQNFSFAKLWKTSPSGMTASLIAGIIGGSIYALGPIYTQLSGFDKSVTALFIGSITFGGLLLQWPIGKFSDGKDRRSFMLYLSAILVIICILPAIFNLNMYTIIFFAVLFGGISSVIYPLAVTYTNDYLSEEDLVPASGGLVMGYGIGAIIGPILCSLVMETINQKGLFYFCGFTSFILALFIIYRMNIRDIIITEDQTAFQAVPKTSPIISTLDPRNVNE